MIKLRSKEEPKLQRLNLVPIMDAVFIFIFFLLFSAQFIKIFELETHAPIISSIPSDKKLDDEPLNLTLKIRSNVVEVYTGIDPALQFRIYLGEESSMNQLKSKITALRYQHPEDDEAIVSPLPQIRYNVIVKVIDAIQYIPEGQKITVETKKGAKTLNKIYSQVVLEPLES